MASKECLEEVLANWSGTGTHVDFRKDEVVPLDQGRFLGHGSMGSVFETTVRGHAFAWKKRYCRRKIDVAEMKEIDILRKLSHDHIIKIAGSYTHCQFLGLLLYPVATCDLATFFEDAEALFNDGDWDLAQEERFKALGLQRSDFGSTNPCPSTLVNTRKFLLSRMGCIVSAVKYLHDQRIRHKDLKPSNILLGAQGLWLADFGTATDFSDQTVSTTDNCERGTPKYFPPEMAEYEMCGRSADIFSLGCVLLEMYTLQQRQTLEVLRELRPKYDKSYQHNLEGIYEWIDRSTELDSSNDKDIKSLIQRMLARDPNDRPTIDKIKSTFALVDNALQQSSKVSLFNKCCRGLSTSRDDNEREFEMSGLTAVEQVRHTVQNAMDQSKKENDNLLAHATDLQEKLDQQVQILNAEIQLDALRLNESDAAIDHFAAFKRSTGLEPQMSSPQPGYTTANRDLKLVFSKQKSIPDELAAWRTKCFGQHHAAREPSINETEETPDYEKRSTLSRSTLSRSKESSGLSSKLGFVTAFGVSPVFGITLALGGGPALSTFASAIVVMSYTATLLTTPPEYKNASTRAK